MDARVGCAGPAPAVARCRAMNQPMSVTPVKESRRVRKLRAKVQPMLPPGVQVNQVFLAQRAVSQAWLLLSYWIIVLQPWRLIAVMDAGIQVFATSRWAPGRPQQLLGTVPPDHLFGEPTGLVRTVRQVGPERLAIHRAYWSQLRAADADQPRRVYTMAPTPAQFAGGAVGPTLSPDGRWWWDGQAWQPVTTTAR